MAKNQEKLDAKKGSTFIKILGGSIGTILAIVALYFAAASYFQDRRSLSESNNAQSTAFAYSDALLNVQQAIATAQADGLKTGQTGTEQAIKIEQLEQTKTVLEQGFQVVIPTLTAIANVKNSNANPVSSQIVDIPPTASPASARSVNHNEGDSNRIIPFRSNSSNSLSQDWQWKQGQAQDSSYRLSSDGAVLTLITGPGTDVWNNSISAPSVEYPLKGNFSIKAKINMDAKEQWQIAGLGFKTGDETSTWISIRRTSGGENRQSADISLTRDGGSENLISIPYSKTDMYVLVNRIDEKFSFSVSENGLNWYALKSGYVFPMPENITLFLYVYSTNNHGILANFSDISLASAADEVRFPAPGKIIFAQPGSQDMNPALGWYPGGSYSNDFRVNSNSLSLIVGPNTDIWNGENTAPKVEVPVSGNFTATVKLNFSGMEQWQVAGLGLRSGDDMRDWVLARRVGAGNRQNIDIARSIDNQTESLNSKEYPDSIIYFKLVYEDPLISVYYGSDGVSWLPLIDNFVMGFSGTNYVYLLGYSTSNHGNQYEFSDFEIASP